MHSSITKMFCENSLSIFSRSIKIISTCIRKIVVCFLDILARTIKIHVSLNPTYATYALSKELYQSDTHVHCFKSNYFKGIHNEFKVGQDTACKL